MEEIKNEERISNHECNSASTSECEAEAKSHTSLRTELILDGEGVNADDIAEAAESDDSGHDGDSADLAFASSTSCLSALSSSLEQLRSLLPHVAMGNMRFATLAHGVADALRETALRVVQIADERSVRAKEKNGKVVRQSIISQIT